MAKIKPTTSTNPAAAGTITEIENTPIQYWYATIYNWDFTAIPNQGYEFDHWEHDYKDTNGVTDHIVEPVGVDTVHLTWASSLTDGPDYGDTQATAYFKGSYENVSAINLNLHCVPSDVCPLTGGGLKSGAVGTSVTFDVAALDDQARPPYRFSHWIDDEGVKHSTKRFSKTFTLKSGHTTANPELKSFVAYCVFKSGYIIRSTGSGLILRGSNDKILRDE